jgi:transposase-like protein
MLPDDLPQDFLEFNARFGTDEQCREYLFRARWPDGFRCDGCGHDHAYTLRTRLVYECVACRKQHSLLAGTVFEQTKTALARWFLAIYLVTSSKGGIAAAELQRQLGFGSRQTAWSWLHKLRKATVRPDREPLAGRVEADETLYLTAVSGRSRGMRPGQPERDVRPRVCDVDGALGLATAPLPRSDGIEGHPCGMSLRRQGGSAHGGASRRGERHGVARHRCIERQAGLRAPGR